MFNALSQVATVTWLGLRTVGQRLGSSLATVFGVMGVVGVLIVVLSIGEGFRRALVSAGSDDTALVLRAGSDNEMTSGLLRDHTRIIAEAPGVLRGPQGRPVASAELYVVVDVPKRATGTDANVPLRGVQPAAFLVRDEVKIIAGRSFEPGRNEIIAGRSAAAEFAGLEVGARKRWGGVEWTVVGIFEADGGLSESEIWCDVGVLQPAYRRGSTFQAVYAKLESPAAFERFKDTLTTDPRLDVKVIRESEYYEAQSRTLHQVITGLGVFIGVVMAAGATFGALNTMYSAVATRTREVATLRALGFGAGPVVISILAEALLLSLVGGALGAAVAYLGFNGFQAATMNWSTFSQVAFQFAVTPPLVVLGTVFALAIGLIGGLFPAIRAARMPVATALREL